VSSLPDYKSTFPTWRAKDLRESVKGSTDEIADLLTVRVHLFSPRFPLTSLVSVGSPLTYGTRTINQRMLAYDPARRISAKASLQHDYFRIGKL
jgi:cyclin-dependent kinase